MKKKIKKKVLKITNKKVNTSKQITDLKVKSDKHIYHLMILVPLLVIGFFLILFAHTNYNGSVFDNHKAVGRENVSDFVYPYPYIIDEWQHMAQIKYIYDTHSLGFVDPYDKNPKFRIDTESGFHIFFGWLFIILNISPMTAFFILPALIFIINAASLYFFVIHFLKSKLVAALSVLLFLGIPIDGILHGNYYFVPFTFSIWMIFSFAILFDMLLNTQKKKYIVFSILIFIFALFTYLPAIILIFSMMIYQIFAYNHNRALVLKWLSPCYSSWFHAVIALLMCMALLLLCWKIGIIGFIYNHIVFGSSWKYVGFTYPLMFFGYFWIFFLSGLFLILYFRKGLVILLPIILLLLDIISFYFFQTAIGIPYERAISYFWIFSVIVIAQGMTILLTMYKYLLKKQVFALKYKKILFVSSLILTAAICSFVLYSMFGTHVVLNEKSDFIGLDVNNDMMQIIGFIQTNISDNDIVFADPFLSLAIYPLTGLHTVFIPYGNLAQQSQFNVYHVFLLSNCEDKKTIIETYKINYVVTPEQITCPGYEQVFNKVGYIYNTSALI